MQNSKIDKKHVDYRFWKLELIRSFLLFIDSWRTNKSAPSFIVWTCKVGVLLIRHLLSHPPNLFRLSTRNGPFERLKLSPFFSWILPERFSSKKIWVEGKLFGFLVRMKLWHPLSRLFISRDLFKKQKWKCEGGRDWLIQNKINSFQSP